MQPARIRTTGDFELFWLSPDGHDDNPGTQASPKRTHAALWKMLVEDYDFCGKSIVIGHTAGTAANPAIYDGIDCRGQLLGGNNFAGQVHFYGNPSDPAGVVLRPTSGQAIHLVGGAGNGAGIHVDGFKLDMSMSPNIDMVTVEEECCLIFGNSIVGYNHGHHDFQVCTNAKLTLIEDYIIDKGSSVALTHLQQDPSSRISVAGDGKFGFLHVKIIGAPTYSQAFCSVDRADCYVMGAGWLGGDLVKTSFDRGLSQQGALSIPVASVAGINLGQMVVSQAVAWGTQVSSIDAVNRIVGISQPLWLSAPEGMSVVFGSRPSGHGLRYQVFNGGLISTNTNFGGGTDFNWFPGDKPGTVDNYPGSLYK